MQERVKDFTYVSGTGSTVIGTSLEDHINEWLQSVPGKLVQVTQSESETPGRCPRHRLRLVPAVRVTPAPSV